MQEIARARAILTQNAQVLAGEAKRLADYLASKVHYRLPAETLPSEESVKQALRSALARGEQMTWDLFGHDLWSLSDKFYRTAE
jgi:hypothetical protein